MEILEKCDLWAEYTYGEYLDTIRNEWTPRKRIVIYKRYKKILTELDLINKKMDGRSVCKLPINETVEKSNDIVLSREFNKTVLNKKWTVCDYVLAIINQCLEQKKDDEEIKYWVGRSLRAFASFLREQRFREQLEEVLNKRGFEYEIDTSVDLDVKYHTDLLLKYRDEEYHLWLYQCSFSGIENTRKKIMNKREGEIKDGFHVLCPINIKEKNGEIYSWHNWFFYNEYYLWYMFGVIESDLSWRYSEVCKKLKNEIDNNIKYTDSFIAFPAIIKK